MLHTVRSIYQVPGSSNDSPSLVSRLMNQMPPSHHGAISSHPVTESQPTRLPKRTNQGIIPYCRFRDQYASIPALVSHRLPLGHLEKGSPFRSPWIAPHPVATGGLLSIPRYKGASTCTMAGTASSDFTARGSTESTVTVLHT